MLLTVTRDLKLVSECFASQIARKGAGRLWVSAISRKSWIPTSNDRVCYCHFVTGKLFSMLFIVVPKFLVS